ncbi:MAG: hypothetical protein HQM08_25530 [Candidatus Riflebacteria bacterium]|nr:hypothetical protein [Candidatus Riflebacteria bacterium]
MRKFLVKFCVSSFFIAALSTSLVESATSQESKIIKSNLEKGILNYQDHPDESLAILGSAFSQALKLTAPSNPKEIREIGFYLASRCLHPSLFPEIESVIEAYLKEFPKGKYLGQILVNKGILDYENGRNSEGREALLKAEKLSGKVGKKQLLALEIDGLLMGKNYKSAGVLLDKIAKKSAKHSLFKADQYRFKQGCKEFATFRKDFDKSNTDIETKYRLLEKQIDKNYFAPDAPEGSLQIVKFEDSKLPAYNGVEIHLFDMTRVSSHHLSAAKRVEKLESFLNNFPESDEEITGRVLIQLHLIYLLEMNDPEKSALCLEKLQKLKSFQTRFLMEESLAALVNSDLKSARSYASLEKLMALKSLFPFDDGAFPRLEYKDVQRWFLLSSLIKESKSGLKEIIFNLEFKAGIYEIPPKILFFLANNNKVEAYAEYQTSRKDISEKNAAFLETFFLPLYNPLPDAERRLIVALLLAEDFPKISVDLLTSVIQTTPAKNSFQHALAILAEIYQTCGNHDEAQAVWALLRKYFPKSSWLK